MTDFNDEHCCANFEDIGYSLIREGLDGLESGQMKVEDFKQLVSGVASSLNSRIMALHVFLTGCLTLLNYRDGEVGILEEGMEIVEQAMEELERQSEDIDEIGEMAEDGSSDGFFDILKTALNLRCSQCGTMNHSTAGVCEKCGASLAQDEKTLSILQGDGLEVSSQSDAVSRDEIGAKKIPLAEARNLNILKEAVRRAEEDELDMEEYRVNISRIMNLAHTGVELFKTDVFRNKMSALPPEQKKLAEKSAELFVDYEAGCRRMLEYDGGDDISAVLEGYEIAEKALVEMDRIQDLALNISEKEHNEEVQKILEDREEKAREEMEAGKA